MQLPQILSQRQLENDPVLLLPALLVPHLVIDGHKGIDEVRDTREGSPDAHLDGQGEGGKDVSGVLPQRASRHSLLVARGQRPGEWGECESGLGWLGEDIVGLSTSIFHSLTGSRKKLMKKKTLKKLIY